MTELIKMTIKPLPKKMAKIIHDAKKKIGNLSVPYKKASIFMDQWVQQNFRNEGRKVGGWKPLVSGGRWKRGGFDTTARILQDTGQLKSSFVPFHTKTNAGIGSDLNYSESHNEGLGGLPVRRMLPTRDEIMDEIHDIFDRHVKQEIRR